MSYTYISYAYSFFHLVIGVWKQIPQCIPELQRADVNEITKVRKLKQAKICWPLKNLRVLATMQISVKLYSNL